MKVRSEDLFAEAVALLRDLEWCVDTSQQTEKDTRACPMCGGAYMPGCGGDHDSKCSLAEFLRKANKHFKHFRRECAARWCIRWSLPTGTIRRDYAATPEELLNMFQHAERCNAGTIEVTKLHNASGQTPAARKDG